NAESTGDFRNKGTFFMARLICFCIALCSLCTLFGVGATETPHPKDGPVRFNRDIRPLLAENCFHCHGADSVARKGKLRFDREEGIFEKRKEGLVVEKG